MQHIAPGSAAAHAAIDKEHAELRARFDEIRAHYAKFGAALLLETDEWGIDPYEFESCHAIRMTPIEYALWHDIRSVDIVVYPQYPVGRFFVDFGNPAAKVAIECDGKEWHQDREKDETRDAELNALGWTVYRINGADCFTDSADIEPDSGRVKRVTSPARSFIQWIADRHPIGRMRRDVNLDRIKALGLNDAAQSAALFEQHKARTRNEFDSALKAPWGL